MGAIVDILFLGEDELSIIKGRYPGCVLINLTNSSHLTQRYRLIVPNVDLEDDGYYNFLADNLIAMSSSNFRSRLESDKKFSERMGARAAAALSRFKATSDP